MKTNMFGVIQPVLLLLPAKKVLLDGMSGLGAANITLGARRTRQSDF